MSTTTTNLGLTKPANNEYVDVAVINSNYDIIDQFAGAVPDDISELEDVAISSPSSGQVLKYNGTSQKWENGSESSHSLDDMSDVTLSTPTNGQILKYDGSSDQWVNGDEVVPINVIANPSATATDTLTKLQVGPSVYSVPQGGTGGNSVSWNQVQATGTKIAEVTIDGATTDVLAPTPTNVVANPSGSATADLTSLQIGSTIYSVPQGGGSWTEGDTYYIFSFDNTSGGSMTATEYLVDGGSTTQVQTGTISFASIIGGGPQYIEFSDIEIRWNASASTYNVNCLVDKVQYGGVQYGAGDNVFSVAQAGTPVSDQRIDKLVQGGSEVSVLTDLQDVTVSSVTNGQVLKFNSTSQKWENANEDSVSIGIDDLTDVDITSASNAQVLSYNGTSGKWVNTSLPSTDLDDLTDVTLSNPSNGQVLKFDSNSNKWVNANESGGGGGASSLNDLTDVTVTSATGGQVLMYDNASSKWLNTAQGVDNLSDVTLTTPTDGQILKYNGTSNKWVNANESGGTTVVANPSGSATVNLDKLQVGNDIYAIPSGGGDIYNLVPRLTANDSSPVGTVSADGTLSSSFQPWHAFATEDSFDASQNGGYWASGSNGGYLQFAFANSVTIKKLEFGVYDASTFTIYYSDDGTNYTQGDAISATPDKTGYICRKKEYLLTGPITCRYIRLVATGPQNIGAVHFYGDSGTSGETTVIANPSGEATVELEKLQVGSTIYSIPEGGSGGSSDYIDVVGTLTAGSTSITLSSPKIKTSSCVFPWASVFGLAPTNMVVQNGSVTLTFPAQQSDVDVMVRVTKLNTGHVYDIDLSTLQANKSWFYYDNVLSSVNDTGDGLQLSGNDTRSDWTTSATIGIDIANMIGTIPVGLTALKLHFKAFEMEGYTGVRFINSNTLYTGQAGGSDAMLKTNGFYQFENNNSSIDEDNYELTIPCTASNLANSYLYIMFFDGMVAGSTNTYSNSLNGAYNIIIDGIDYVTGGN